MNKIEEALEDYKCLAEYDREYNLCIAAQQEWQELKQAWNEYKAFLQGKYPAEEGKEWEFTCERHKRIDSLINKEEK